MTRNTCLICGSKNLTKVLDLGEMPSSNDLVSKNDLNKVKSYPLKYYLCNNCTLFQQLDLVDNSILFRNNYTYMTGVNKGLVEHFNQMADEVLKFTKHRNLAYVIGSNDGTEIEILEDRGFKKVVGIEPAKNIAKLARAKGLITVNDFFTYKLSRTLVDKYGKADLVLVNNVFAHIPDPKDMLEGMKAVTKDSGNIVIEVHWLRSIIDKTEIETLYAEHYFVWTIKAFELLAKKVGLNINGVFYTKNHGGSLRFVLGKTAQKIKSDRSKLKLKEKNLINEVKNLQKNADRKRDNLVNIIETAKRNGKRVGIWSVPAKVPTLINFCGLTNKDIDYAYEVAPTKIGKYIPKANILIKDEKYIEKDMPDYLIIGAWNYIDLAKEKLVWYVKKGGRLINPLEL